LLEQVMRAAGTRRSLRARLVPAYLPPTLGLLRRAVDRALACEPDAVILLAEAGAGDEIGFERFARNRAPEDAGGRAGARLVSAGPAAYLGAAAAGPSIRALQRAGIPCRPAADGRPTAAGAGYYLLLHRLHERGRDAPVLLLRVPERSATLPLRRSARAVLLLVDHLAARTAARAPSPPRAAPRRAPAAAPGRTPPAG
jgi:pyrrolidone-carboxylate peptidase